LAMVVLPLPLSPAMAVMLAGSCGMVKVKSWSATTFSPPPNQPAAATYDAIQLLARVIRDAGPKRDAIRRTLAEVGRTSPPFEGVAGRIAFDSLGDVTERPVFITVVRDGQALLAGSL